MRFLRVSAVFFSVLTAAGCGDKGGGPAAPSNGPAPAPSFSATLRFVSMRTGQPVSGVIINSSAGEMLSQADGTVRLNGISRNSRANASASGFLPIGFDVKGDGDIGLWPADGRLPEDFTFKAIYNMNASGILMRPLAGSGVVLASREILADSRAHKALLAGVAEINNSVAYMNLAVGEDAGSDPAGYFIRIYVDPNDRYIKELNAAAVCYSHVDQRGVITSAKIVMGGLSNILPGLHLQRAMTHEIGHGFGLSHTEGYNGMMWGGSAVSRFSPMEREVLDYAGRRIPGNRWPDDSTGLSGSSGRAVTHICVLDESGNPIE